jgi:hypothetical protein
MLPYPPTCRRNLPPSLGSGDRLGSVGSEEVFFGTEATVSSGEGVFGFQLQGTFDIDVVEFERMLG